MTAPLLPPAPAPLMGYCPECQRQVRVSEPYAFRGADRLRATLACGHVVLRDRAFGSGGHTTDVRATGGHGYPWRAHCTCGWQSKSYAATHAAETMGEEHRKERTG